MSLPSMLYGSGIGKYNQTSYGGYNHNLAALDGQMHLEIDGTEIEIEVLGVDHPHHAFGCGLHGRGIECVGFRRDQRVYSVGELLCPLCASCGACVGGCIC